MAGVTITLTPVEARVVFNTLDGASDAGACEGGNTEQESEALNSVMIKLLKRKDAWIKTRLQEG